MRKTVLILACLWFALAGLARAEEVIVDRLAAVVNGEPITLYEITYRMRPYYEQLAGREPTQADKERLARVQVQVMNQMINEMLIAQEIKRLNLSVKDTEVANEMRRFKESQGLTDAEFVRQLKLKGMNEKELEDKIRQDMLKHRLLGYMVKSKVVVTDEEIKAEYEATKDELVEDRKVDLRLILMPPLMAAEPVAEKIKSGEMTFEKAAAKYSQGPGKESGGDIGQLAWKDLAEDWQEALEGLKPGEVSKPFKVGDNEAILQLVSETSGQPKPLEQVREAIYNKLYNDKMEKLFNEYLKKLHDRAVIEIKLQ